MSELKKERNKLEEAAQHLLNFALKSGAKTAEVCGSFGQKTKIALEKQDYHLASADDGYSLGLRVLIGRKQGFASCNTLDTKDLKEIAMKAVEIAGFSPENPNYSIEQAGNIPSEAPKLQLDEALYNISLQTQKEWTKLLAQEALADSRFRLNEGSVEISSGLSLVTNSHGVHQVEEETACTWGLMGMGVAGETITSFDYFHELARSAKSVPDKLITSTRTFRDRVLQDLKQGPAHSYKGHVVLSPRAVIDILVSALEYHLNGRSVVEGTGKWKLADLGKNILHPGITLTDMAWLTDRFGYSLFDREGTPTQNLTMIENGVLKNFFFDHYSAIALSQKSTGHAAGGPSSLPTVGAHCLVVGAGNTPLKSLIQQASEKHSAGFLYVNRYSGQVDPVTGDFSGVVKGSQWWKSNERQHAVKETLISGNIFESFGSALVAFSKETEVIQSAEESPTFLIDNVSVTCG